MGPSRSALRYRAVTVLKIDSHHGLAAGRDWAWPLAGKSLLAAGGIEKFEN
jgi:hypothetical protein